MLYVRGKHHCTSGIKSHWVVAICPPGPTKLGANIHTMGMSCNDHL